MPRAATTDHASLRAAAVATTGVPATGTVIAEKYRVESVLGSGGMGCVVRAEHLLLRKPVAVKFLQSDTSASARRRLFREARATQALSSENVVRVFDIGVHGEAPYIVMELLEGIDLAARVDDEGPLAPDEAVDCLLEACVAVAEAHANGIFHRDIKPANLFFTRTQTQQLVKVLDFGISKVPETPGGEDCEKTAEDVVLGTPYYMSPEQLRNPAKVDARTDVWALAVTLFYLLTGEHPFPGDTPREVTAAIFTDPPRELRVLRAELPGALCQVIAEGLVKRAEERTPSVAALVQGLLPFASKRGRLAAERVAAMGGPPPPRITARTARSVPATTTDAGLASTLPPTAGAEPAKAAERASDAHESADVDAVGHRTHPAARVATPRMSTARAAAIAVFAVGGLVAIAWLSDDRSSGAEQEPQPSAASGRAAAAEPSSRAPDPEVAPPAKATSAPLPPATLSASSPAASQARPAAVSPRVPGAVPSATAPPPSAATSASTTPSAAPSVTSSPKRPRTDIDGVPIVD